MTSLAIQRADRTVTGRLPSSSYEVTVRSTNRRCLEGRHVKAMTRGHSYLGSGPLSSIHTITVVFGRIFLGEDHHRGFGARAVFGQPDFAQIPMRVGLKGLPQLVEDI
jgi:hypothetical protein